jgi:hypothetical protein
MFATRRSALAPAMSTAADRMREHRRRERQGKIQLVIEADAVAVVEVLVEAQLLPASPLVEHSKHAIEAAVEQLLTMIGSRE